MPTLRVLFWACPPSTTPGMVALHKTISPNEVGPVPLFIVRYTSHVFTWVLSQGAEVGPVPSFIVWYTSHTFTLTLTLTRHFTRVSLVGERSFPLGRSSA